MAYGFKTASGSSADIEIISSEEPPGVYIDDFTVAPGATENRSYTSFVGTELFVLAAASDPAKIAQPVITINNGTKSVSVTSTNPGAAILSVTLRVVVFGR